MARAAHTLALLSYYLRLYAVRGLVGGSLLPQRTSGSHPPYTSPYAVSLIEAPSDQVSRSIFSPALTPKRVLIIAGVSAVLLVLGLTAFTSASHSTGANTVTFIAKPTQLTPIDLPPAGFGQGDEVVFHDQLLREGAVIGQDGGSCQATLVAQGQVPQYQCLVTFVLRGGQVATQGLLKFANPASFSGTVAVTGGTGIYQEAGGQATIHQTSATIATITLSITS